LTGSDGDFARALAISERPIRQQEAAFVGATGQGEQVVVASRWRGRHYDWQGARII
jgi:hypothetical protein